MLSNMLMAVRLQSFLKQHKIEVVHYIPGRIRLKLPPSSKLEEGLKQLRQELEQDPSIHQITFTKETGSLLIQFDPAAVDDRRLIEGWFLKAAAIFKEQ